MNTEQQQIQDLVKQSLESGVSQNNLAAQMGVSPATLHNIKQGNWKQISAKMILKLKTFYRTDDWPLMETQNFLTIKKACETTSRKKRLIGIAAYTGAGKTVALRHYARSTPNTFYVLADVNMTKKDFLMAIQQSMGVEQGGRTPEMVQQVVTKMNLSSNSLLIVDDAGKLSDSCFRQLQIIYDRTEFQSGIIIAGTYYLKNYIDKMAGKDKMGFRELKRRISYWQPLKRPSVKWIKQLCKKYGINEPKKQRYVYDNAKDYGTLRNLMQNVKDWQKDNGESIDHGTLDSLLVGDQNFVEI